MRTLRLLLAALACCIVPLQAQTAPVLAPSAVAFTASPDQALVLGTTPILTNYVIEYYQGTTLVKSTDIGKPTPAPTTNDITSPLSSVGLVKNTVYTLQIAAVGPGGTARSANSVPFAWPAPPAGAGNPILK